MSPTILLLLLVCSLPLQCVTKPLVRYDDGGWGGDTHIHGRQDDPISILLFFSKLVKYTKNIT
jgi:hypothetical protein